MKAFLNGYIVREILLPVSFVIVLITASVWVGGLAQKVSALETKDAPSRQEFNAICEQLSEIKKGVNDINYYLRSNK